MTTIEETFDSQLELYDEVYSLLLEENRTLKRTKKAPGQEFLDRKRDTLPRIDSSLAGLKELNDQGPVRGNRSSQLIKSAQNKLMKIFLLDRENEQLLLKYSMPSGIAKQHTRIPAHKISQAYEKLKG